MAAPDNPADSVPEFTDGRTARRDRNRRAVLDAVLELFSEGDLSPSPESVAQRSGVSLRSVYRFVSATDDLVRAAIDRHLERVGPLFVFEPIGEGTFEERVRTLVDARLRLYQAIAPAARAAVARTRLRPTPASEIIRQSLHARRGMLRLQLARHFEAELGGFGDQSDAVLGAADALTQIETIDWFMIDGGYSSDQARQALLAGLHRLLGPGADVEPQPADPAEAEAAATGAGAQAVEAQKSDDGAARDLVGGQDG